ncbi:olfactory receptor 6C75-like [Tachyglossus aculeatus]|uniref:olfactory receptor 6C75-like n=1 Tax=Tachyglossus aculeatus TaxID=9261 RepID=UPI0018F621AC|nr:olfactory receptor 6C75-like [Tachyglossus aculeatus]
MRNHTQVTVFILLGLTDDPDLQAVSLLYTSPSYVLNVTGNLTIVIFTLLDSRLHTPLSHRSAMRKHTQVTRFILLGLTDDLQAVILLYMSVTYVLSITGNLTIITFTLLDSRLHTPMNFVLSCFSFLKICFTSTCLPRFLSTIVTWNRSVSYNCCATQQFLLILLGVTEFFLLASMSYNRYVAICRPLYSSWFRELTAFIVALGTLLVTLVLVAVPYAAIARTILRLSSTLQKRKAFSTYSSHTVIVSIEYGS